MATSLCKIFRHISMAGLKFVDKSSSTVKTNILHNLSFSTRNAVTVNQLAKQLNVKTSAIFKVLQQLGEGQRGHNAYIPSELIELISLEMGVLPMRFKSKEVTTLTEKSESLLKPRPPIVTVMGHVDHGKTTLLDNLRKTSVASGEAGGITQHIGAFSVPLANGETITFLDTPGHAAFSKMRSRGANVTDIIVLVVAADDGVMAQTVECIELAKQEDVPIIVAINKCDKFGVNVSKVKQQLLQHEVQLEEFSGDVQAVEISALTGAGLEGLEEAILAQAELKNIRSDPTGPVEGVILEAKNEKKTGSVATVLVLQGILRKGCVLVAGQVWGKARGLFNENGKPIIQAMPSTPVVMTGWREVPSAGDKCIQVEGESRANEVIQYRRSLQSKYQLISDKKQKAQSERTHPVREKSVGRESKQDWREKRIEKLKESLRKKEEERQGEFVEELKVIPVIIKGDVMGSVEALEEVLQSCQPEQLHINVIQSGVGNITETDIDTASSVKGVVLAYNVLVSKPMIKLAKEKSVTILKHNVIYKLIEELKDWLGSLLPSVETEEVVGEATVTAVFRLRGSKKAHVGGCRVRKGQLVRDGTYQLWRNGELVYEGRLSGMKREKNDISVALKETECGLSFSHDPGWEEGDKVLCLRKSTVHQKLTWDLIGFRKG